MKKIINGIIAAVFAFALAQTAQADFAKTNPVTGETESYTWKFVGTDTWNGTGFWQDSDGNNPSKVPAKTGDDTWAPILFDGSGININAGMSVEGWNLRMGVYNGATIQLNNFVKYQGDTTMWMTVDETSQLTIGGFGKGNIADNQVIKLSTAKASGIAWNVNLESTGNANNTFEYYLKGAGSVSYKEVSAANHKIKMADVTLSGGEKAVRYKTLVSFTSSTKTFTADATIKVKNSEGAVLESVNLSSIASATTLTTERAVGACELVQTSTGILLYYVDGTPEGPTVIEDGETYEISEPVADIVQVTCNGSFTITGTDSYSVTEADLANLNLDGVTGTVTLGANTCYALGDSRTLPGGKIAFGEGSAVAIAETQKEYGLGDFSVSGLQGVSSVRLTRFDGTTVSLPVTAGVATLSSSVHVSGIACWCAYEMDYESGNSNKNGFQNSGTSTTALHDDSGITGDNAFYNGMLYTYAHPWRDITYPTDGTWTAVVRCTVPAYENAAVITFGTCTGGLIGLVAGHDPETEMKLVKTTGNSAFTTLATMTVQDATTAQHVYTFSVETNQTVKVYCDGELVLDQTFDSPFSIGGGIQIGSVHGGVNSTGIIRFAKDEYPANTLSETVQKNARIDCVRLYKYVLSGAQIAQLSVEFPAVKLYRATVADGAATDWNSLSWSPAWDGGNAYSKIILTVEGDASLTLPESIAAEDFFINVAEGATLTLAQAVGGTTIALTNPMEVNGGAIATSEWINFGNVIGGTGTLRLWNGAVVTRALSGTAKLEIPSGATVEVDGGSIASTVPITGAGTLDYSNTSLPDALTFGSWTGTVVLPAITSVGDSGLNLSNYGVVGSTVRVTDISGSAWISNNRIRPTLEIAGNMTLRMFSASYANTIFNLAGSGSFSLLADGTASGYQDGYFLVNDVSEFTGSITIAAPGLAIGAAKPSNPTTYGQIVITTNATVGAGATWTAPNGVVLASAGATLTVPGGASVPAVTSGVFGYRVVTATEGGSTVYSLQGDIAVDGVTVPISWVDANGSAALQSAALEALAAALQTERGANGLTYFESYALGLVPSNPSVKPISDLTASGSNMLFYLGGVGAIPAGVTLTVQVMSATSLSEQFEPLSGRSMTIVGNGSVPTETISVPLDSAESVRFYYLDISISATP